MSDMGNDKNASDVADTPTPDADEAVDEQTGSDLEGNAHDDVVETEDAGCADRSDEKGLPQFDTAAAPFVTSVRQRRESSHSWAAT